MRRLTPCFLSVFVLSMATVATTTAPLATTLPSDMAHLPDFAADASHPVLMVMDTQTLSVPFDGWSIVVMDGGHLTIPDGDVRLVNLIVMDGASVTLSAHTHLTIKDAPFDVAVDPEQWGHGVIAMGDITWIGAPKTPWLRLGAEPHAGDTQLTLGAPQHGWQIGDRLVLGDSRALQNRDLILPDPDGLPAGTGPVTFHKPTVDETESVTVAALSADGLRVTLAAPLAYTHPAARDAQGAIKLFPFVSNHTRSAVLQSEHATGVRGHFMVAERSVADVEYVQFEALGRTCAFALDNTTFTGSTPTHIGTCEKGRYALHEHHLIGRGASFPVDRFIGNAVNGSPKWGITVHDSHYTLVQDNVVVGAIGAGIVTETGQETGNVIDHNLVVDTPGSDFTQEFEPTLVAPFGTMGDAYWFGSDANTITRNVAVGFRANGFFFTTGAGSRDTLACSSGPGTDPRTSGVPCQPINRQIEHFDGNEAVGGVNVGLNIWILGSNDADHAVPVTINGFTAWHVRSGIFPYVTGSVTINDFTMIGPYDDDQGTFGAMDAHTGHDFTFNRVYIANVFGGIWTNQIGYGSTAPTPVSLTIHGGEIHAIRPVSFAMNKHATPTGEQLPTVVTLQDLTIETVPYWAQPSATFQFSLIPEEGLNATLPVLWRNLNVNGQSFQLFTSRQAPSAPMPASGIFVDPSTGRSYADVIGAPVGGLTNAQAFSQFGVAYAGAVATCTTPMAGTSDDLGAPLFTCPLDGAVVQPPPPPPPLPPSPPPPPSWQLIQPQFFRLGDQLKVCDGDKCILLGTVKP